MPIVATQPAVVKTAAVKTLFDYRYLGRLRNRQFGQGVEAPPVAAEKPGLFATDPEYRRYVEETTYSAEERRLSLKWNLTCSEVRDELANFASMELQRDESDYQPEPITWTDCERFTMTEHDYAMANGLTLGAAREALEARELDRLASEYDGCDPAEQDELRMVPSIVTEADCGSPAPARHRRVNQAKARRMAVAGR